MTSFLFNFESSTSLMAFLYNQDIRYNEIQLASESDDQKHQNLMIRYNYSKYYRIAK